MNVLAVVLLATLGALIWVGFVSFVSWLLARWLP